MTAINALIYMKLMRADQKPGGGDERTVTFSHRRFQEYFATSIVLSGRVKISPKAHHGRAVARDGSYPLAIAG